MEHLRQVGESTAGQLSGIVDYAVKLKADNEQLEAKLEDKSRRIDLLEERIARGVGKSLSAGIDRMEAEMSRLKKEQSLWLAAKVEFENRLQQMGAENRSLRTALEAMSREKNEEGHMAKKIGDLTEELDRLRDMEAGFKYLQAELAIMRQADEGHQKVQKEVEEEFVSFRSMHEDQISKTIALESANKDLLGEIDRLKHRVAVQDIEIEQLQGQAGVVSHQKAALFKEKVAEFEEEKNKILEQSEANAREVDRLTALLRQKDDRLHVLEQYLLKERHERNKLQADAVSYQTKDQLHGKVEQQEPGADRDAAAYYDRLLDKFDAKSKDHVSKRKASTSTIVERPALRQADKSPVDHRKLSATEDHQLNRKVEGDKPGHRTEGRPTEAMPGLGRGWTGSRMERLAMLTSTNDKMEAWLSTNK